MLVLVAIATATQAIGADTDAATAADQDPRAETAAKKGTLIKVEKTRFGKALVNRAGRAVYLFDLETGTTPQCYDECARAWPPVLTKGRPVAGDGAKRGKLGTTRRTDGRKQVTYAGHPLYYYVHDTADRILCQNVVEFGGRWLLVGPRGGAIR